jgi:hypothetical protein
LQACDTIYKLLLFYLNCVNLSFASAQNSEITKVKNSKVAEIWTENIHDNRLVTRIFLQKILLEYISSMRVSL